MYLTQEIVTHPWWGPSSEPNDSEPLSTRIGSVVIGVYKPLLNALSVVRICDKAEPHALRKISVTTPKIVTIACPNRMARNFRISRAGLPAPQFFQSMRLRNMLSFGVGVHCRALAAP
jgi:hypothetical protein